MKVNVVDVNSKYYEMNGADLDSKAWFDCNAIPFELDDVIVYIKIFI